MLRWCIPVVRRVEVISSFTCTPCGTWEITNPMTGTHGVVSSPVNRLRSDTQSIAACSSRWEKHHVRPLATDSLPEVRCAPIDL